MNQTIGKATVYTKLSHDRIVEKYGVKTWAGDAILGQIIQEGDEFVKIRATAVGFDDLPKTIQIPKQEIEFVEYPIVENGFIIWMRKYFYPPRPLWGLFLMIREWGGGRGREINCVSNRNNGK